MKLISLIFLLSRPLNILIAIASILIMSIILNDMNWINLTLTSLVLLFYMSGANILNDYIDIGADCINKPHRILVSNTIHPHIIIIVIIFMFSMGSIFASYLPLSAMRIALFFALPSILLYEFFLKRIPLIGNIIISLLVGIVFVFVAYSLNAQTYDAYKLMILAFFLNLIREIIKDIQDMPGDHKSGLLTLPLYIGIRKTVITIRLIYLLFFIVSLLPMYTQVYNWQYIPLLVFLIHTPLLYITARLNDDITQDECSKFSKFLKIIIINGIIIILISAK